jgi:hypothetical protein
MDGVIDQANAMRVNLAIGYPALIGSSTRYRRKEDVLSIPAAVEGALDRVILPAPYGEAEIAPEMLRWDHVLGNVQALEPPMLDLSGWPAHVRVREPVGVLHELTSKGANAEAEDDELSRLPAPKHTLLTQHDIYSIEHEVGAYIGFYKEDDDGNHKLVCPARRLLDHWLHYQVSRLPKVSTVLTLPLALSDGTLLAADGLDRDRRLVLRCEPKLLLFIPERQDCDEAAVLRAFEFLVDHWLVDVAADLPSKCVLIAYALSILERVLFPNRPIFMVSAGQRSSGKTTVLQMLVQAALGVSPPAAAWARDEDERRKAMLGYLLEGLPTIIWDNIKNGSTISSATLEKVCTAESYSDRLLGASPFVVAQAYTIQALTGNNIQPRGDLASRCLHARLAVDRPDPQNRTFVHEDPLQWTRDHRGAILRALYTILLGNPQLDPDRAIAGKTRFKAWWSMVGAAVEYAGGIYQGHRPGVASGGVDFAKMFDATDATDEESNEIGKVLDVIPELNSKTGSPLVRH